MTKPTRPLLRWHGGKWILAPWIISHFPAHRIYVEPFGGAGSVLLRKDRAYAEVYNDLDQEVVNLFRVMRDDDLSQKLIEKLRFTPFSRTDFEQAYTLVEDPIERARNLAIRSFMGFGSNAHGNPSGFRSNSNRSGTSPAHDWVNYPDNLPKIIERLRGVVIESRNALELMPIQDGLEALFYVDPPYVFSTRSDSRSDYTHELTDADHLQLLEVLRGLVGMVVLSGYACDLYDDNLPGWQRIEKETFADGARERVEVLWINPACWDALQRGRDQEQIPLLMGASG